ncbi:hypothetical protein ACFQO9_16140 [Chryseobacterium zhengzhouense]|uniref:Uncharacterized protein n=1 Tax=Chryseobacterium zhengzhouense TaxID=1636086 RepID=A0ABW2M236_9FLAO
MKKIYSVLIFIFSMHLLMSTDCSGFHHEVEEIPNKIKVSLDNSKVYHINDTITIRGRVSVNGLNSISQDSVKLQGNPLFMITVSKLIKNKTSYNLQYALNKFKIIAKDFQIDNYANCPNANLYASATEYTAAKLYRYEVKLIPLETGDFSVYFNDTFSLQNIIKKQNLLQNYPITGTNSMVWEVCGNSNVTANLTDGDVFIEVQ